jgi:tRNA modification GTPase
LTELASAATIFALSTGLPPAGIGVVRISGPGAGAALHSLSGKVPTPRTATLCRFRGQNDETLDHGLAFWFPGPASVTGEDLAELHVHGGRAVVASILAALSLQPGLRLAQAGEFTRRAFENGRIDLTEAEGLADLLAAETELQRKSALMLAEGGLGRIIDRWQSAVLQTAAAVEAALDFEEEEDVAKFSKVQPKIAVAALAKEIAVLLQAPPAERLRDGVRVVIAGPPNEGKSSLFNYLVGREAAIVTDIAGTTRDRIEAPVVLDGIPLLVVDTAGLRDGATDRVEAIGIARTGEALAEADIILWLGSADTAPDGAIQIAAKSDLGRERAGVPVSTLSGAGVPELRRLLTDRARALLPGPDMIALNVRHRTLLTAVRAELVAATATDDLLITAEHLRCARVTLDKLTGRAGVDEMLDALFGAFCIGK